MTKDEFIKECDVAIEEGKGIVVSVDVPENVEYERVITRAGDVKMKKKFYDKVFNENMVHKNAHVKIVDIAAFENVFFTV